MKGRGLHMIPHTGGSLKASNNTPKRSNPVPAGIAFAGLMLAGFLGRSSRKLRQLACVIALASLGLAISACGGGGGSSSRWRRKRFESGKGNVYDHAYGKGYDHIHDYKRGLQFSLVIK